MRFVYKHTVNTQLLKGHNIVFLIISPQFFQSGLQTALGAFQLLDAEFLTAAFLQLRNAHGDLRNLILQKPLLPLPADGDFLKLAVTDDNRIIVAGGDPGAELFAVFRFKVPLLGHKDIGGGVQTQKFRCPLFC